MNWQQRSMHCHPINRLTPPPRVIQDWTFLFIAVVTLAVMLAMMWDSLPSEADDLPSWSCREQRFIQDHLVIKATYCGEDL